MGRSKLGNKRIQPDKTAMKAAVKEVVENKLSLRKAALKYNISKSAIARSVNKYKLLNDKENESFEYHPNYDIHKIFTDVQEKELCDYLITSAKHNYGLTTTEMRKLAFKYAVANKINVSSWEEKEIAGKGWLRMFRSRHSEISLRKPEATSLARSTAFNKQNVNEFFSKYIEVLKRNEYQPYQIWNIDETGLSTVQAVPKILAPKGIKQLASMTSAERGINVTMIAAINGAGNSVPPLFVFPRVHFKPNMLKGAPPGSVGVANPSGWSNEAVFSTFIEHLIKHIQPGPNNPHVLILDNHESHYSPQIISRSKEVHITIVTLPPHCSHKMQPLDKTVFGPFKTFYNKAMNDWMNSPGNAGRPVTIYDVAEIAGTAYEIAFTIKNITSGFKSTGIVPLNSNIFDDDAFLAANVTDRPMPLNDSQEVDSSGKDFVADETRPVVNAASSSNPIPHSSKSFTPEMLRPLPKAAPRKTTSRRRPGKSRIITDSPEETEIKKYKESKKKTSTNMMQIRKQRVKKRILQDSSDDEIEINLEDSSDNNIENEMENYEREKKSLEKLEREDVFEGDYVLVQCKGDKYREHFVANILKCRKKDFDVKYLKKMHKTDTFIMQEENPDIFNLQLEDIIMKLPQPESVGSTKRSACHLKFGIDFTGYCLR